MKARKGVSIMPLQNRVDPFGDIHAVAARGMFTGNRGVIHDPDTKTLLGRRWTTKAWIVCTCDFRGRRRDPMGRNARSGGAGWTELFFLDEVTALAAGHRPCFYCRREAAKEYAGAFSRAFGVGKPTVRMMDERLHAERMASAGRHHPPAPSSSGLSRGSASGRGETANGATREPQQILGTSPRMTETSALPDGTMIHDGETAYALRGVKALRWSFEGYGDPVELSSLDIAALRVLTPATSVAVLAEGFAPAWHASAG